MSIKKYQAWKQQTEVGCIFARLMARRPTDYGQKYVQFGGKNTKALAKKIAACVDANVTDTAVSVVTIVLPGITDVSALVAMIGALEGFPKWTVTRKKVAKARNAACVTFGVIREIPFEQRTCPSEVLIVGPFKCFPATRNSPVTAMEVFVGEPMPLDPKTGDPTTKANLAHIKVDWPSPSTFKATWRSSIEGRRKSLGINLPPEKAVPDHKDDHRAKAKVAFSIPLALAKSLGVTP